MALIYTPAGRKAPGHRGAASTTSTPSASRMAAPRSSAAGGVRAWVGHRGL